MKKIGRSVLFVVLFAIGFYSCRKDQLSVKDENIQYRSSEPSEIAYRASDGIVYLLSGEHEIPLIEDCLANNGNKAVDKDFCKFHEKKKLSYIAEKCVVANGERGLLCKPQKKGDCSAAFSCIIAFDEGDY